VAYSSTHSLSGKKDEGEYIVNNKPNPDFRNAARVGSVGRGTALQTGMSRVRFQILSLEFFTDVIVPFAYWL
jgi:hypothetical protein